MVKKKAEEKIVRTTTWSAGPGCHGGCGMKLYIRDGKLVRVEGDENNPWNQGRTCPRNLALTQYIYHPDRILYPMKRAGNRGEGKWERITWDEAYDTIEKRFKDIRDKYGAESVIFVQGTGRDIGGPITFLAYSYGSPNWVQLGLSGHSCFSPRAGAQWVTTGEYLWPDASQLSEKRYENPEWKPPECIILWAVDPTNGCIDFFHGSWIIECMKRGSRLIVIDPRVTWVAGRAEVHLQIRPGTDGALALGMLNVIISEGLYDKEFVGNWCYGFDELKERVREYPPEKVARITGLPEDAIVRAARLFATSKPAAIHWGVPIDMNAQGSVVSQAISHLWAITGNIDVPGGMVIARPPYRVVPYPFTRDEIIQLYGEEIFAKLSEKRIGTWQYPMFRDFRGWAQPDETLEQIETGKPYPIKAAWIQTNNVLISSLDPKRHYNALKKLDFIVVVDLFLNPTSQALGDIFLPAATYAEKESFRSFWNVGLTVKALEVGECKSDWEINLEMAKRLSTRPIPYNTVKDLINSRLKLAGTDYDELAAQGSWKMQEVPYRRWEKGLLRRDGKAGFNTPTGKVELWSKWHEKWGLDPLPYFEEPPESPLSTPELWKEYPLIMGTGARSPVNFHSEHRQIPWLREIRPDPSVELHPKTAAELGIANGEWVYIENRRGRVKARAKITPTILPYVVMVGHGWWLPETDGKAPYFYGVWEYNVNNLIPMGCQGRSGFGGGPYKTTLCRVRKIKEAEK